MCSSSLNQDRFPRRVRCGLLSLLLVLLVGTSLAHAQSRLIDDAVPAAQQEFIEQGKARELQREIGVARTALHVQALALAWRQAGFMRSGPRQIDAFERADEFFDRWLDRVVVDSPDQDARTIVTRASALIARAEMNFDGRSAPHIISYQFLGDSIEEIDQLRTSLERCVALYDEAWSLLEGLYAQREARENELYQYSLYRRLLRLRLDVLLGGSWSRYYRGLVGTNATQRMQDFAQAEQGFRRLIESGLAGEMIYECRLALGMSQREQGDLEAAQRTIERLVAWPVEPADETTSSVSADAGDASDRSDGANAPLTLQIHARYELGQVHLAAQRFDAARRTLRPLARVDVNALPAEQQPATLYFNLGRFYEAYSYLLEARAFREDAIRNPTGASERLRRSSQARVTGLSRMHRLERRGGAWKAIVQRIVAQTIDQSAPPNQLTVEELLYSARTLREQRDLRDARRRLEEAAERGDVEPNLRGVVLFELGTLLFELKDARNAALRFAQLARELPEHERAADATANAFRLWSQVALEDGEAEDYAELAIAAQQLVERYPEHPDRAEAQWLRGVALQSAGQWSAAGRALSALPVEHPRYVEAQYRAALIPSMEFLRERASLTGDERKTRGEAAAERLLTFADQTPESGAEFQLQARLRAAELLALVDVAAYPRALELLAALAPSDPALIGRKLGAEIQALRAAGRFDEAADRVEAFLAQVPTDQAAPSLVQLATGMREEVEHRVEANDPEAADLAKQAVELFERLEVWVNAADDRASLKPALTRGLTWMLLYAGRIAEAQARLDALPDDLRPDLDLFRLRARVRTAQVEAAPGPDAAFELTLPALKAWSDILRDRTLRTRVPEAYWEARFHFLALRHATGESRGVVDAIRQQRIVTPEMGGERWSARFKTLEQAAAEASGVAVP